ncbi:mycofactocin-coupled SDR family oxidoreductase [Rhodococcus wratislaviensis]|uniref:mycofactocin-coupled SDR family oxidoreductase n=1 Tax=Rhodococcus wratislaviensis TaxID=44752 RepID=UPI0035169570
MTGRVGGKVALITGAARGQGRSHAIRLAQEGADIIAIDICDDIKSVPYAGASEDDLALTVKQVEAAGGRILTKVCDIRNLAALEEIAAEGVATFGKIDVLVANAGIFGFGPAWELDEQTWQTMIDVNLTGTWKTTRAVIPHMLEQGSGGSIILTSAGAGLIGLPNGVHYASAKHGVTGLMRTLAIELAPHQIRCNSVHTTTVDTPMVNNQAVYSLFMGGNLDVTRADAEQNMKAINALPVPWLEPADVSNAVLYLASEESRYVTGATHVVDAGNSSAFKIPHLQA